jgi:hypothetical protein
MQSIFYTVSVGMDIIPGVRILAPGCGWGVVTAEGRRVGSQGCFPTRLNIYIYLHESIDFCFTSIHTVHLTVYTVPSW